MMPMFVLSVLLVCQLLRLLDLFLLLLDEVTLHRVVVVVIPHKYRQLSFFG